MTMTAMTILRGALWLVLILALLTAGPLLTLAFGPVSFNSDWRAASQRSTGQAPDPATNREAIVQVYAGRAFNWRGAFAVHTWLAAKPPGADHYVRYEAIGWNLGAGRSVVSVSDLRAP